MFFLAAVVLTVAVWGCGRQHATTDSFDDVAIGDINLDGYPYTMADAVLFSNYFVQGTAVFSSDLHRHILAGDVNQDGVALEVSDLQYLIRILVGDAADVSQLQLENVTYRIDDTLLWTDDAVSAVYMVAPGEVSFLSETDELTLEYEFRDGMTYVLMYSLTGKSAQGYILSFSRLQDATLQLAAPSGAATAATQLPLAESVYLEQNHPNPFTESTIISFHLPEAADYHVGIYDVEGQPVGEYSGHAEAGVVNFEWSGAGHAPGVYFYRLEVNGESFVKKMILL
ncbi:MAG TPA: T9SS type A sorting domain-containing protein [candidate division Zixibacteria bacterium]|nr:T9SS type A sorting domain-containing protein [candidate division Zixibacteria bacterium]